MAEYSKNDVTENGITPYDQSYESQIVLLCSFYDEYQYERWVRYGWDLYGCITTEERDPILETFDTVAIVSTTLDQDACWNLAKCMLSEDVQVNSYYNPINIAAFYRYVDNCIYAINQERIFYSADYGNIFEITEEDIENYRAMLESADHTNAIDSEIYAIVCEEIQAYFDGSKTLDQVIEIINSRAQLVVDERG